MDQDKLKTIPENELHTYYLEWLRRYRVKNKDKIQYSQNKYNKKRLTISRNESINKPQVVSNNTTNGKDNTTSQLNDSLNIFK